MFIHLHVHSHYSLLDGLSKIDELVAKAKEYQMPALALTDHGSMYGVIEFYQKCLKAKIKPIIGVEAYLAPHSRFDKKGRFDSEPSHLILLAENQQGYQNLLKLTTLANLEGFYYKPRVDWEILEKYHHGLIALTACLQGEIPKAIMAGNLTAAEELILKYQKLFGPNNFYFELQHHPNIPEQNKVNEQLIELAKKFDLPLVATNDCHYLNPEDAEAQDILLCIQTKRKQAETDRLTMLGEDFSFTSPDKMEQFFGHLPEASENSLKIAERCNVKIELDKIHLPNFKVPNGQTDNDYLKELCLKGLPFRYGENISDEIKQRLAYELSVIVKTGFASYFLIVQDFINWAKQNGIVVGPGRGSAAGSLVSYLLNITNIDPIKFELIFERFLNADRISMPDIDLDFTDTRRDEVIQYVANKYGHDHVSQIITFGTMAARAAVRDVGRVLGLSYSSCDRLAKLIPINLSLTEALKNVPELKEAYQNDAQAKNLIDFAKKLEGVARHSSTHACGVLITPEPLDNFVPLQYSSTNDSSIISQYSLHPVEDLGLLKMDFLGLKNLTIIETALEIITKTTGSPRLSSDKADGEAGQKIDLDKVPLTDERTFELLRRGETVGVFQLESSGMRRYLVQLKPTDIEDIIVMISLYRPGPMELIPDYISRKRGLKTITYLHPQLKPILEKTYGIAIYQEQVMEIARELAGFSYSQADVLRKAVGKKIKSLLVEQEEKMVQGMMNNGVNQRTAQAIWEFILPFARYGFNRAHAASYAMISYQTAYLKANFPTQFMAALLTSDRDNIDRIALEIAEAEKMGIQVLPPDINESYTIFTMVVSVETKHQPRIRFGLGAIKNVGEHITKAIIHERKNRGPFTSLENFLTRVTDKDLNKKSLESLIKSGALDKFGERNQLLYNIDKLLKIPRQQNNQADQQNLFAQNKQAFNFSLKLDEAPEGTKQQRLAWEKELLGIYLSEHPLDDVKHLLPANTVACNQIGKLTTNQFVKVAGIITKVQRVITRNGQPMVFVTIEDASGSLEVLVFPKILETTRELWQEDRLVVIQGKVSEKDSIPKLICDQVEIIDPAALLNLPLKINLPNNYSPDSFQKLKEILEKFPGQQSVIVEIGEHDHRKQIKLTQRISYSPNLQQALEQIIPAENIKLDKSKQF